MVMMVIHALKVKNTVLQMTIDHRVVHGSEMKHLARTFGGFTAQTDQAAAIIITSSTDGA